MVNFTFTFSLFLEIIPGKASPLKDYKGELLEIAEAKFFSRMEAVLVAQPIMKKLLKLYNELIPIG